MSPRVLSTLALAAFSAAALSAATDPFVGTWKLNPAKSKFSGEQIKIDDLGQNRYKITGGGSIRTPLRRTVQISQSTTDAPRPSPNRDRMSGRLS
jgi:hypothetical protein